MQVQGILNQKPWALALGLDEDLPERSPLEHLVKDVLGQDERRNLVMVTTDREIPHAVTVGRLPDLVQWMKSLVF